MYIYFQAAVDPELHSIIDQKETLRAKFLIIQERFKPCGYFYGDILEARYKKLQKLEKNKSIDTWLLEWKVLMKRCREGSPLIPLRACLDFATAVGTFDRIGVVYLNSQLCITKEKTRKCPDIEESISLYTDHYKFSRHIPGH